MTLRGQLKTEAVIRDYLLAGRSTLTLVSTKTGERYTFAFKQPPRQDTILKPTWVRLLSGPDNENDYEFLGTIWHREEEDSLSYSHSPKSRLSIDAPSVKVLRWFVQMLDRRNETALAQLEVWHEGRCGRCGRKLTVPASVARGFGPECAGLVCSSSNL